MAPHSSATALQEPVEVDPAIEVRHPLASYASSRNLDDRRLSNEIPTPPSVMISMLAMSRPNSAMLTFEAGAVLLSGTVRARPSRCDHRYGITRMRTVGDTTRTAETSISHRMMRCVDTKIASSR